MGLRGALHYAHPENRRPKPCLRACASTPDGSTNAWSAHGEAHVRAGATANASRLTIERRASARRPPLQRSCLQPSLGQASPRRCSAATATSNGLGRAADAQPAAPSNSLIKAPSSALAACQIPVEPSGQRTHGSGSSAGCASKGPRPHLSPCIHT